MRPRFLALATAAAIGSAAHAQCTCAGPFSITVSTDDLACVSCTNTGSVWDINISATTDNGDGEITVTIQATASGTQIDDIVVTNALGSAVALHSHA